MHSIMYLLRYLVNVALNMTKDAIGTCIGIAGLKKAKDSDVADDHASVLHS